jgi:two-component sensor histidine kinase
MFCNNIINYIIIFSVTGLFLVLICFINNDKNEIKKKNKLLIKKKNNLKESNLLLRNCLKNKELFTKEIHHRVKNNLQLIISLQNIQARRNINGSITEFLSKEQNRITAMALIHNSLYFDDDSGKIYFKGYINNLVKHIKQVGNQNNISLKVSCNKLYFDIEIALILGLIINELISNSFKHAFPDLILGIISISIVDLYENNYKLVYSDNGIPFAKKTDDCRYFGLKLIQLLVKQLKADSICFNEEKKETTILFSANNNQI